jgi:hypothetical protein
MGYTYIPPCHASSNLEKNLPKKLGPCSFYFALMDVSQENGTRHRTGGRRRADWAENRSADMKKIISIKNSPINEIPKVCKLFHKLTNFYSSLKN